MNHIWTICIKEEAQAKTRKLKKVWTMYNEAKSELADIEAENNREVEAMLESIRDLQKGLQLNQLITHRCDWGNHTFLSRKLTFFRKLYFRLVPDEMLQLIDGHCQWNEMIGEWQLKGVAYTGNNMMKRRSPPPPAHSLPNEDDNVYLVYNRGGDTGGSKKNGRKKKKNLQNELNQIMQ